MTTAAEPAAPQATDQIKNSDLETHQLIERRIQEAEAIMCELLQQEDPGWEALRGYPGAQIPREGRRHRRLSPSPLLTPPLSPQASSWSPCPGT